MLANEQAAVRQYNKELVDCFLPQMDVVVMFFRQNNYITLEVQLQINSHSPVNKPQCLIDYLLQAENGWNALNHFLHCYHCEGLSKHLEHARSLGTSIVTCNVSPASTSQRPTSRKLWNAPLKMTRFVGRTLLLEELNNLRSPVEGIDVSTRPTRILATCAGIGGVGKSSLALEFAYRNVNIYGNIFWISATSKEIIETLFMKLAEELRLSASDERRSWKDTFLWLHTTSNWLMIFDDAQNYVSIKEYIPRINGDILITSRYSIWPHPVLNVHVFTDEEAWSFISAFLPKADRNAANVLAHELENFPLAPAQACAYVVQCHISIEVYLEKLKRSRADMLAINILPHDCNSKPVYSTLDITVEQIGKECAFTVTLLELCSLLEGHSIPDCLLHEFATNQSQSTEVYEKSRSLLCNYLLLTVVEQHAAVPCVSLHPLVQTIIATKLTADKINQHCINTQACIHQLWPDVYDKDYGTCSFELMPQLLKCLEHIQRDSNLPLPTQACSLNNLGVVCGEFGDYTKAKALHERELTIKEAHYGPDHKAITTSLSNLGVVCHNLGDHTKAKALHERALKIKEAHYGPDHIVVLYTLSF